MGSLPRQIQGLIPTKTMKMFLEGLPINCHVRYCGSVYLAGEVQLDRADTSSGRIGKLQVLQNEDKRVVLKKRRSDQVNRTDLLNQCNVNHIGADAVLQEINRASHNCTSIMEHYQFDKSSRSGPTLRTSKDPQILSIQECKAVEQNPNQLQNGGSNRPSSQKYHKRNCERNP